MSSSLIGNSSMMASRGPSGSSQKPQKIAGYDLAAVPTMSPESYRYLQQLMGQIQPYTTRGIDLLGRQASGDEEAFKELEAPYQRALTKFGGQLGSRFSGAGMGARGSSGFQNALAEGATDLSERLGNQRLQLQQNAIKELLGLGESLLGTKTHDYFLTPPKRKWWESAVGIGAPIAGAALGSIGGPGGAVLGGQIGSQIGSSFLS